MINTLKMSLKIDLTYQINAFLSLLKRLPILRDLFTDDIWKSKNIKKVARIFVMIYLVLKKIIYRFLYFLVIYVLSFFLTKENLSGTFCYIYFIFTLIGMWIHNQLLDPTLKKYFSILLFQMDAKKYSRSYLLWNLFTSFLFNSLCFFTFSFFLSISPLVIVCLILFSSFARIIGETLNILYYKKYHTFWYHNNFLYFSVLGFLLVLLFLPVIGILPSSSFFFGVMIVFFILSFICLSYLIKMNDFLLLYKTANTKKMAMNMQQQKAYSKQALVEMKTKDQMIHNKKLKGKKGYDLFNTIFMERHKEILFRSAKNYACILGIIYIILIFLIKSNENLSLTIHSFLSSHLGCFVLIMYFINRGAIITQAMFFNCDHAMLAYNFYKEPDVLLGLFKKRLQSICIINLLPAFVIALGNTVLLWLTGSVAIPIYITTFLFILVLSIFFSVHYLVIYYLLQPYNQELDMKKISYSFVLFLTYFFTYFLSNVEMSSFAFSIFGLFFTIIYIIVALILIKTKAKDTFHLN